MVLGDDNALIYQRNFLAYGKEPTPRSVRNLRSRFQREISSIRDLLGHSNIGTNRSILEAKPYNVTTRLGAKNTVNGQGGTTTM
jgi:hypothetical protein